MKRSLYINNSCKYALILITCILCHTNLQGQHLGFYSGINQNSFRSGGSDDGHINGEYPPAWGFSVGFFIDEINLDRIKKKA